MVDGTVRKFMAACASLISAALMPGESFAESLTMTTWYPAPVGVYQSLITSGGSPSNPVNTILSRDAGRVGIGTPNPLTTLHIYKQGEPIVRIENATGSGGSVIEMRAARTGCGNVDSGRIDFYNLGTNISGIEADCNGADDAGNLIFKTKASGAALAEALRVTNAGNVGIGTQFPGSKLEIQAADSGGFWTPGKAMRIDVPPGRGVVDAEWVGGESGGPVKGIARFSSGGGGGAGASYDFYWLLADPSGNVIPQMRLVGQTGGLILRGSLIQQSNPDIAENIRVSTGAIEAGDLVEPDPNFEAGPDAPVYDRASVIKTTRSYSPSLLGAISTNPGTVLNAGPQALQTGGASPPGSKPIALSGRIPVKVCGEGGNIRTGDWITSSSLAGVGMKASRPGRVLGIALESFAARRGETGRILVFINPTFFMPEGERQ